ncbi:MAG: ChaN family lipoprotein [Marinobacter sp.]|uniref:ChaN family lipoprotein n=1 Tax=Marinobacter sp. TaxID=50741 RepID=UPI00396E0E5A
MKLRLSALSLILLAVTGCVAMPSEQNPVAPPKSQYDARVFDAETGTPLTVRELAGQLANTDVVVVGEYHGHHASHLLQARLQQALFRQTPRQILTMEQFNLDHQDILNRFLAGDLGETEMIEDAEAWNNYRASYRPLMEFARQNRLPVIAANAPADVVRCVGRKGPDYLKALPPETRALLPETPFLDTPAYKEKFVEAIGGSHGTETDELSERMRNTYHAQLLRDNTMARAILEAQSNHPGHQILHTTGTFHSEERLGTVAVLAKRAPELSIAVITPVFWPDEEDNVPLEANRGKGDYLYFIQPLPEEFRDPERERKAMEARFTDRKSADCK